MNTRKKGFTLVELSIVLVIIGLLIGGILAAQSMINTAKVQAFVRQVGQFDTAVANFQTKFGQLPGNAIAFGGDGDGIIADDPVYFPSEVGLFWYDLSQSGLMNPNGLPYLAATVFGTTPDKTYCPQPALNPNALFFGLGSSVTRKNYYLAGLPNQASGILGGFYAKQFKAADILAIDTKMDDGLANSGNVSGWDNHTTDTNTNQGIDSPTLNNNDCTILAGQTAYNINGGTCNIRIRIGASTGNLK